MTEVQVWPLYRIGPLSQNGDGGFQAGIFGHKNPAVALTVNHCPFSMLERLRHDAGRMGGTAHVVNQAGGV